MSWGMDNNGRFGLADVKDYLRAVLCESEFPAPWDLTPRKTIGSYHGTEIRDALGRTILSIWRNPEGAVPSRREKEYFGPDWTPEAWADYCCDSHWESEESLCIAELIVSERNAEGSMGVSDQALGLLWESGRFDDDIFSILREGLKLKRRSFDEGWGSR